VVEEERMKFLRNTASRMKFRERYANQTTSIHRAGVAAAALSRFANLLGAGLGGPLFSADLPAVLAVDSKETIAARNLQVQRKYDVREKATEERRERKRKRE